MVDFVIHGFPSQTPYSEKFLFLREYPKCTQLITLQDFSNSNIKKDISYEVDLFACGEAFLELKN